MIEIPLNIIHLTVEVPAESHFDPTNNTIAFHYGNAVFLMFCCMVAVVFVTDIFKEKFGKQNIKALYGISTLLLFVLIILLSCFSLLAFAEINNYLDIREYELFKHIKLIVVCRVSLTSAINYFSIAYFVFHSIKNLVFEYLDMISQSKNILKNTFSILGFSICSILVIGLAILCVVGIVWNFDLSILEQHHLFFYNEPLFLGTPVLLLALAFIPVTSALSIMAIWKIVKAIILTYSGKNKISRTNNG